MLTLAPAPPVLLVLALALLAVAPGRADFVTECPERCECVWVGGKKQARCTDGAEEGLPRGLSSDTQVLELSGWRVPRLHRDALSQAGLQHLQKLFLRGVGLRQLDKRAFSGLSLLVELDLAENQLSNVDIETFSDNEKLRRLSLAGNPLLELKPLQFPALPHLQQLNLSHCRLASVAPRAFKKLPNLTKLNLDGNKLAVLESDIFQSLNKLKALTLHDNPWRCDCHLRLFRDWLIEHNLYQEGTSCVEPERLVGKRWNAARSEEFACRPHIHIPEPTVVADVGQNVTLRCQISGNPAAATKWVLGPGRILHNNTQIPFTNQQYIIHEEGNVNRWTNLTITRVTEQDAGQYLCVGSNPGGVVEHNVTLVFRTAAAATPGGTGLVSGTLLVGLLAGGAGLLLLLLLLLLLFCCCCRRGARAADKEAAGAADQVLVMNQKPARMGEYEKLPQTDVEMERLRAPAGLGEPSSSVMCNPTGQEATAATAARRRSLPDATLPLDDPRRDYPDLLHLPRRRCSLTARPGYVTLPRRPRTPSWAGGSPAPSDPVYDTLGPRTTVDGSSRLSLTSVGVECLPAYYLPVEAPPLKPKKVSPPVLPKPQLNGGGPTAVLQDEGEDGTEV
ncbi:leucine-rich repeat-containing protein 24-like [Pollicipes pollicipes]|uniref:leucine-rich repeat-containing protein 24-like n=1 Tax=Pollicipes pollicipes TaxID=41117 RepID=UPI00188501FA|nr:leucine-rich repeat-containing protein 24-like [Pollicipes pollicipes]